MCQPVCILDSKSRPLCDRASTDGILTPILVESVQEAGSAGKKKK